MKRILSVVALVALSGVAKAQDKATEFKFGGEIRQRFYWDQNPRFIDEKPPVEQHWEQRNQFHVSANSGDKLQAYFNFLHATVWGGPSAVPTGSGPYLTTGAGRSTTSSHSQQNTLMVHEAWFLWKATDTALIKSGRQSATWGDGLVVSKNDWNPVPNNWDGLMTRFSWDFLDLDVGGGKFADAGITNPNTPTSNGGITASGNDEDKEIVFYGLNASLKNLPDVMKKLELLYIHVNGDAMGSAATFLPGMSGMSYSFDHFGLHTKGEFAIVDYRLDFGYQMGKEKGVVLTTGAAGTDVTQSGTMFDIDLGVNFPEMMKARVSLGYHMDSGDDSATSDKHEAYQPLFHDQHAYAGNMNMFGFGNLTNIRIGASLMPMEETTVGLAVHILSRTSDKGTVNMLGPNSGNFYVAQTAGTATTPSTDKSLGTEIDLWMKHNYGNGLSMLLSFSQFSPGSYLKPTSAKVGNAMQLLAQAQYNF